MTLWSLRWARERDFLERLAAGSAFFLRLADEEHGEELLIPVLHYLVYVVARRVGYGPLQRAIGEHLGPRSEAVVKTVADQLIHEGLRQGRKEGRAEGKAEGRADAILLILRSRLGEAPADVVQEVRATTSFGELDRLTFLAATANSFEEFRGGFRG